MKAESSISLKFPSIPIKLSIGNAEIFKTVYQGDEIYFKVRFDKKIEKYSKEYNKLYNFLRFRQSKEENTWQCRYDNFTYYAHFGIDDLKEIFSIDDIDKIVSYKEYINSFLRKLAFKNKLNYYLKYKKGIKRIKNEDYYNLINKFAENYINKYFDSSLQGIFNLPEIDYLSSFLYKSLNQIYDLRFNKNNNVYTVYPKGYLKNAKNLEKGKIISFVDLFDFIDKLCEFYITFGKKYYHTKLDRLISKKEIFDTFKLYSKSNIKEINSIIEVFYIFLKGLEKDFVEVDFLDEKYIINTNSIFNHISMIIVDKVGQFLIKTHFKKWAK